MIFYDNDSKSLFFLAVLQAPCFAKAFSVIRLLVLSSLSAFSVSFTQL